jgi:hypothetical protein
MLRKYTVQETMPPVKNLVRQRCAEGFNSGVKGVTSNFYTIVFLTVVNLLSFVLQHNGTYKVKKKNQTEKGNVRSEMSPS